LKVGYGPAALEWTDCWSDGFPLIATELQSVAHALAEAFARRRADRPFFGGVLCEDARTQAAVKIGAPAILAQFPDYDSRRVAFEALAAEGLNSNNVPQREWVRHDPRFLNVAQEFLLCADAVVARSRIELERLCALIDRRFAYMLAAPCVDRLVPEALAGTTRDGIAVWAPRLTAAECAIFAFALEESRFPIRVICAGGPHPGVRATFFEPPTAGDVLSRALVIVDASLYDPGSALALAKYGVPLASAVTSGAHEWVRGLRVYDPWNSRSIYSAVFHALGDVEPPQMYAPPTEDELLATLDRAHGTLIKRGPLVSVVVPTYNRRDRLPAALDTLAHQTYEDLEILVVNDGGEAVDDIVSQTPHARVLSLSENRGPINALNDGIEAARGKYIALLADDDGFLPDHCSRLVAALERTGAAIAHGNEIAVFTELNAKGIAAVVGHAAVGRSAVEPSMLLVGNHIGGPAIMIRRDALVAAGMFDVRHGHLADFETWLRLSKRFDFIHVDRMLAFMSMRNDTSQISVISGNETARMHAEIYAAHPVEGRADIEKRRQAALRGIAAAPQTRWPLQLRLDNIT
jgi:hypothetical protein